MGICPICNGFQQLDISCPSCEKTLDDKGRVLDFFDDYSPYMPIDQMKLEDGYPDDYLNQLCPHFLQCSHCGYEVTFFIKE